MADSPFTVVAELVYDPASNTLDARHGLVRHTAETCPGRPCSTECDHVEFIGYGLDATDPGTPAPGNRLQHRRTRNVGTVLSHEHCDWPAALGDGTGWSFVRFDNGHHAYCPNSDLAPRNGQDTFQ